MRQLGDLLVWSAVVAILIAVVYFTPMLAQYMSTDGKAIGDGGSVRSLALNSAPSSDQSE